jgi:hypothetical protein
MYKFSIVVHDSQGAHYNNLFQLVDELRSVFYMNFTIWDVLGISKRTSLSGGNNIMVREGDQVR